MLKWLVCKIHIKFRFLMMLRIFNLAIDAFFSIPIGIVLYITQFYNICISVLVANGGVWWETVAGAVVGALKDLKVMMGLRRDLGEDVLVHPQLLLFNLFGDNYK